MPIDTHTRLDEISSHGTFVENDIYHLNVDGQASTSLTVLFACSQLVLATQAHFPYQIFRGKIGGLTCVVVGGKVDAARPERARLALG